MRIWERDGFRCKILDPFCNGRIEAHHIFRWSEYRELRYEDKNGITLCRFHHPRRKTEEMRLANLFLDLIGSDIPRLSMKER
jgi:hypothetical protein